MCNAINKNEFGFSLLELAIVLVLVGLVLAPAISLYQNYRIDKDWTETEENIDEVMNSIGGFRSVYSRYPCPASQTAIPGSLNYGLEDCSVHSPGTCINGICTYSSNIAGQVVVVGALPFKIINIQESESYDKSLNRFTYAVTRGLTDSSTFSMSDGGIGIVDKTGASIIDPPDRGHFVVLSHGSNKIGGYTRAGVQGFACASGTSLERENCDADSVFLSGEIENNFDDRIEFFSSVMTAEWQTSANNIQEIHLKNVNNFSVGATIATDLSNAEEFTVRSNAGYDGTIMASNNFYSETLCEYGANGLSDCFAPRLIAGFLNNGPIRLEAETTGGSGMSCYKPSLAKDEYLVGIANGEPICSDEIFVSCPSGSFITGIDSDGNVVCNVAPLPRCADKNITTTCGDSRTLAETYSGGYHKVYSGKCRKIINYDNSYFATALSGLTLGQIENHIDGLNDVDGDGDFNDDRDIVDCGPTSGLSQVRDTYLCTAGNWNFVSAHEKLYPWSSFPSNTNAGSPWPAENSYNGPDINNNNNNHDCWCREDYRVRTSNCPSGQTGKRIKIQKHRCPQTAHSWNTVYTSDALCACTPGTTTTTQSCNSYYDEVNNPSKKPPPTTGLSGIVKKTFDVTCSGNTPVTATTPSSVDTSGCYCPSNSQYVQRKTCPNGTTNSWSWSGGTEVGIETLSTQDWTCPSTTSGGLPDPGSWGALTPYNPIPACTCDSALKDIVIEACPAGLEGAGMKYEREWDCTTSTWEPKPDWTLLENNCNICTWTPPSGSSSLSDYAYGKKSGSVCACGSDPIPLCWNYGAGGKYKVWTGCQCIVQVN